MDLARGIMTISAILIFKFHREQIVAADHFWFDFLGLRKNFSIFLIESSCSWMLHRKKLLFRCSTEKRLFRVTTQSHLSFISYFWISFFDSRKRAVYIYVYIYIGFRDLIYIYIKSWIHVPNISILIHPIFLFRQCDGKRTWERDFNFQSPIPII